MLLLNRISLMSVAMIVSTTLIASGCSRAQRKVQVLPPATQNPGDGKDPGQAYEPKDPTIDPTLPGGQEPGDEGTAVFVARIDQTDLAKYVDLNAKLEYRFKYLDKDEQGLVALANGKAEINVKGLKIGQSGELSVELFENGTLKLKGTKADVVLKAGQNVIALPLSVVGGDDGADDGANDGNDDGGDQTAELILQISIEGEPGSTGNGGNTGNTGNTGNGTTLSFTEIQPLAETYCVGCHQTANTEKFWADGKAEIGRRLQFPTSNSRSMPIPDSTEQKALSDANRAKLLQFVQD